MVASPVGSIHSLSAEPVASSSTALAPPSSSSPPSLGNIPPIPSTSGLHHVNEKGSTQGKHVPLDDSLREEQEAQDAEAEDDDSSDSSSSSDHVVEGSRPQSPSGLVDLGGPQTPPPDPGEGSGSDDEGDSDDEDSEGSDEEEEEPTLKYSRLGGSTTEILAKDSASALAVSTQYIVRRLSRSAALAHQAHLLSSLRPSALTMEPSSSSTSKATSSSGSDLIPP